MRKRLFELNNNGWRFRAALNEAVNASFGHALVNGYRGGGFKGQDKALSSAAKAGAKRAYLARLAASTFVLCPPGLGMDSYRVYEVQW